MDAEAPGIRSLIAEDAGPGERNVPEPFHGTAVCRDEPAKAVRVFALFARNRIRAML
jgi:hypothetical protein